MKTFLAVTGLMLMFGAAHAQKVEFRVKAPSMVTVGEMFKVEYSLNAKPDANFSGVEFENFDVVAGPSYATSVNVAVRGTNVVREDQHLYTYLLMANKTGVFNIPSASVTVDGQKYSTRRVPVEVVEHGASGSNASSAPGQGGQPAASVAAIGPEDIFIRVVVDKTNVYKGQPIRALLKIYTRNVPIVRSEGEKIPAFNGFWKEALSAQNYEWTTERYNSKVYESKVIGEYLLFPQQSGVLQIDPFEMTIVGQVMVQQRAQNIFDDIFSAGPLVQDVRRKITTQPVKITVKDWPSGAPASFNGAVGNFTMDTKFPQGPVSANSSFNISAKISGTGNLPLVQAPTLNIPGSFEQYNIKTTENLSKRGTGISGDRQFEYPLIPRAEGEYQVDPVVFTYFNPATDSYVTLSSEAATISVVPDSSAASRAVVANGGMISGLTKEDIKLLGQDIHFIKLGTPALLVRGNSFAGSLSYYIILAIIIILAVTTYFFLSRRLKELQDEGLMKGKRANKVALQRLRAAENYMKAGSERQFYEEMLRAFWGYMSDKLNIPVASLTKENIREGLIKNGASADYAAKYNEIISDCEYAQYAPGQTLHMRDVYRRGIECISKLESIIKK